MQVKKIIVALILLNIFSTKPMGRGNRISQFDDAQDTQELLKLIQNNHQYLFARKDIDVQAILKYRTLWPALHQTHHSLSIKVLRENNQLVGFIAYEQESLTSGGWKLLAIKEEFRRHGYGKELLNYAINDLQQKGVTEIYGETLENNTSALEFYRKVLQNRSDLNYDEQKMVSSTLEIIRLELRKK